MRLPVIITALYFLILLGACGPVVQVKSLKPAEIDMSGLRRIVILDFDYRKDVADSVGDFIVGVIAQGVGLDYGDDVYVRPAASHATGELIAALGDTGYFTILDTARIRGKHLKPPLYAAQDIGRPLNADAVIAGDIDNAVCKREDFLKKEQVYNKTTGRYMTEMVPRALQKCRLTLLYRVVRVTDNTIIATKRFSAEREEEVKKSELYNLHDPDYWYTEMIDEFIPEIVNQLAPHETVETRRLKNDTTHDPEMERALAQVKAGNLDTARQLFLSRWRATGNQAAGYNAALLTEAQGELEKAIALLDEVIRVSNDGNVLKEHHRMLDSLAERKQAMEQLR